MSRWALVLPLLFLTPAQASWVKMPASELIGREVVSRDGRTLGEVEDVVIDVRAARVPYAVLTFGGWMGLGEDLYAVPVKTLTPQPRSTSLVLNISTAPLVNVPGFRRDAWPGDAYWRAIPLPLAREHRPPLRQFVRASELIGRAVTDRTGAHVGELEDAVLEYGLVLYLLFDYEEGAAHAPPLRLAPQVFSFPLGDDAAVVNLARERLARR